jgi:hypothetical protein
MSASNDDDALNADADSTSLSEKIPSDAEGCQPHHAASDEMAQPAEVSYPFAADSKEVVGEDSVTYPDGGFRAWSVVLGG